MHTIIREKIGLLTRLQAYLVIMWIQDGVYSVEDAINNATDMTDDEVQDAIDSDF